MFTLSKELIEYASAVAAAEEAERDARQKAYNKLSKSSPAMAELLIAIVAKDWAGVTRQIQRMQLEEDPAG